MRLAPTGLALCVVALSAWAIYVMLQAPAAPVVPVSVYSGSRPQGHVYTSASERPADINPLTCRGVAARNLVLRVTHDALLDRDARTGELRPALARSYERHDDGLGCTYELRPGVTFADGSAVTGADVLFGWQLYRAGLLPMGFVGDALRLVSDASLHDGRLRVRFTERHFAAAASVGEGWLVVQKEFFVSRVRDRLRRGEAMPDIASQRFAQLVDQIDGETGPGTGPYQVATDDRGQTVWQSAEAIVLTRNERSWRRSVRPGSWNFAAMKVLFRDQAGARNALLRREVDWYTGADLDRLLSSHAALREHYVRRVYDYPQLGVYRMVWNCRRKPFDDARVRRTLAYMVDRDAVVELIGVGAPAVAHAKPSARLDGDLLPVAFDLSRVRRQLGRLREEGVIPKPLTLSLLALDGTDTLRGIVALLRDAARKSGIELNVRQLAFAPFLAAMKAGDWDALLVLQSFDATGDPYRFLHGDGSANYGHWSHSEADRLASEARTCMDEGRRWQLWRELHQLAAAEQPACLIAHPKATVLVDKSLNNLEPGAYGIRPEWAWVPPEAQRNR